MRGRCCWRLRWRRWSASACSSIFRGETQPGKRVRTVGIDKGGVKYGEFDGNFAAPFWESGAAILESSTGCFAARGHRVCGQVVGSECRQVCQGASLDLSEY